MHRPIRCNARTPLALLLVLTLLPVGALPPSAAPLGAATAAAQEATIPLVRGWASAGSERTTSAAWGDVDRDGDLDLAVGGGTGLYRNDGGTLTPGAVWRPADGGQSTSVAWGDVDRDGDLDLAAGNEDAPTQLYRNCATRRAGDGCAVGESLLSAAPVWSSPQSGPVTAVAWGDADGDGDLDLAVGFNYGLSATDVNLLYINESGVLSAALPLPHVEEAANTTTTLAWGDADGDGDLDLAIGSEFGPDAVLRNCSFRQPGDGCADSDGLLSASPAWASNVSGGTTELAWGDADEDGDLDLARSTSDEFLGKSPIVLHRNCTARQQGDGCLAGDLVLTAEPVWSSGPEVNYATSLAWGDADGDGDLDLAVGNADVPDRLYRNEGATLSAGPVWSAGPRDVTLAIAWGDMDGDGDLDLLSANDGQNMLYRNDSPSLGPNPAWSGGDEGFISGVAWGDVDGDGDLDLALSNAEAPTQLYRNCALRQPEDGCTGASLMSDGPVWSSGDGWGAPAVAWGDVDGDGDLDLAAGTGLYENVAGRLGPRAVWQGGGIRWPARAVAWGDMDGDGDLDLAAAVAPESSVLDGVPNVVYENVAGTLRPDPVWRSAERGHSLSVAWGDVDGDGDLDLAFGTRGEGLRLYVNEAGMLGAQAGWIAGEDDATQSLAWGDVDGDGDLDLAAGNGLQMFGFVGQNRLYLNAGGTLEATASWSSAEQEDTESLAWGDVDGDGDLDLAVGNNGEEGEPNRVYRNDGGRLGASAAWTSSERGFTQGVAWGDVDGDGDLDLAAADAGRPRLYLGSRRLGGLTAPAAAYLRAPGLTAPLPSGGHLSGAQIVASRYVSMTYILRHPEGVPAARVRAQFSLDGGGSWLSAVPAPWTPTADLPSSPQGVLHTFAWDTQRSGVAGQTDTAVVRLLLDGADPEVSTRGPGAAAPAGSLGSAGLPGPFMYGSSSGGSTPFRLRGVIARVVDRDDRPLPGALVYRLPAEQARGATLLSHRLTRLPIPSDHLGYVNSRDPIRPGDQLVAVKAISETEKLTYVFTSAVPSESGLDGGAVGDAGGVQTLRVTPANPLLLIKPAVSLEWDARLDRAYVAQLERRLQRASELLYDWSNGQIALGRATLHHDRQRWDEADIQIFASNQLRPNATQGGITEKPEDERVFTDSGGITRTLTVEPGQIRMGASWSSAGDAGADSEEEWARALAHEVAHWALFLDETYLGKLNDLLVPVDGCLSPMSDPYIEGASEFRPSGDWPAACRTTLQHQSAGVAEWSTIKQVYDSPALGFAFNEPPSVAANPGPYALPLGVTTITEAPLTTPAAGATIAFGVVPPGGARYEPSPGARAFLLRTETVDDAPGLRLLNLGAPTPGQVVARGYRPGDRLCVFDPAADLPGRPDPASLVGCQQAGDRLNLSERPGWRPDVTITPRTTRAEGSDVVTLTLQIAIPASSVAAPPASALPTALEARLYSDIAGAPPAQVTLPLQGEIYAGTLSVPSVLVEGEQRVVESGYLQVWVEEAAPRRETVVDYTLGGNPAPKRRSKTRNKRRAPAVSADGQATIFADGLQLAFGQFFALQRTSSVPNLPPWATPVGEGYRLIASDPGLLAQRRAPLSLSLAYGEGDVPLGLERDLRILFSDGSGWRELPTELNTARNEAAATVQERPGTYLLIASLRLRLGRPGWNLIFAYPGATQRLPDALAGAEGSYSMVYGYDEGDADDPWKLYAPGLPAPWDGLVNDLDGLETGAGYWVWVRGTQPVTVPVLPAKAGGILGAPPATYYGLAPDSEASLTVRAYVGPDGVLCGETTTEAVSVGGRTRQGFSLNVLANGSGAAEGCGTPGAPLRIVFSWEPADGAGPDGGLSVGARWDNTRLNELSRVYLPGVAGGRAVLPDLQVVGVTVAPAPVSTGEVYELRVTVRNAGPADVTAPFWVDLYLGPEEPPEPGQGWSQASEFGASWRVLGLGAGRSVTLSSLAPNAPRDPGRDYSRLPALLAGETYALYVQADVFSADGGGAGAIVEGAEGNNIGGPYVVTPGEE